MQVASSGDHSPHPSGRRGLSSPQASPGSLQRQSLNQRQATRSSLPLAAAAAMMHANSTCRSDDARSRALDAAMMHARDTGQVSQHASTKPSALRLMPSVACTGTRGSTHSSSTSTASTRPDRRALTSFSILPSRAPCLWVAGRFQSARSLRMNRRFPPGLLNAPHQSTRYDIAETEGRNLAASWPLPRSLLDGAF